MSSVFTDPMLQHIAPAGDFGGADRNFICSAQACRSLLNRYSLTQDSGDGEGFAALFAEHAIWKRPGQAPLVGRDRIRDHAIELFADHSAGTQIAHLMTNFDFSLAGATAISRCYALAHFRGPKDDAPRLSSLLYLDRYCQENGAWKIQEHEAVYIVRG